MTRKISAAPLIYVFLLMVPIYWLVIMSVKTTAEISGELTFYPHAPTFENYAYIFSDPAWYWGYVNAVIYVLMNVVISVFVAVPAAYGFSRYRFFGDRFLFFGLLAFRMMAPAVLIVPYVQIFSEVGMVDTHLAVALAHCFFNVPLAIWILEGFISAIPREMDDTARIDGYGTFRFFRRILVPQIAPGIAVTAFFCFMFSWIESLLANALTVVQAKPINGIMSRASSLLAADVPFLAAASVLGLIPGIIMIAFMKKHLARGFSMGRVV